MIRLQGIARQGNHRDIAVRTHRQALAVETPDSTRPGPDRSRLPAKITNSYLPPIEARPGKRRSRPRDDVAPVNDAGEPFDVSALIKYAESIADADGRHWPTLADGARDRVRDLEKTVGDQKNELSTRCSQIADLSNANQQQAEALLIAREAIEGLDTSVTLLRQELTQQEHEAANAKQELLHARNETHALREKAEKTEKELAELLQKSLELSTALNERDVEIASAQEKIASLEADQFAGMMKNAGSATARKETGTRSGSDERRARLEQRVEELENQLAARDRRIRKLDAIIAKVGARYARLRENSRNLESERRQTSETLRSQADSITTLSAALRAEREVAERKLAELTGALQREREEHSVAERESATIRREIALLLPKLATTARSTL